MPKIQNRLWRYVIEERAVWQLICHHTYKWHGLAVDLSPEGSQGKVDGASFSQNGAEVGSGALDFQGQASVRIAKSNAWRPLRGIGVECLVKLPAHPLPQRRVLVEGDGSFTFAVSWRADDAHIFLAEIESDQHDLVRSWADTPDGSPAVLPIDTWVSLAFTHDGIDRMELYIDGARVAQRRQITRGVASIGPAGISIGNSLAGDAPLRGQIDEVKVWRLDPHERERQFLSRPVDAATARCIENYTLAIRRALPLESKCFALAGELEEYLRDKIRVINGFGTGTKERLLDLRERYDKLWRAGNITGPEMEAIFTELQLLLEACGIDVENDSRLHQLVDSECFRELQEAVGPLECDPEYVSFMKLVADVILKRKS